RVSRPTIVGRVTHSSAPGSSAITSCWMLKMLLPADVTVSPVFPVATRHPAGIVSSRWPSFAAPGSGISNVAVAPSVAVGPSVVVRPGSRREPRDQAGIAHFLEHLAFKGPAAYPPPRSLSEAIEGVGGSFNAATDREATIYWVRVPRRETERALTVLGELVSR